MGGCQSKNQVVEDPGKRPGGVEPSTEVAKNQVAPAPSVPKETAATGIESQDKTNPTEEAKRVEKETPPMTNQPAKDQDKQEGVEGKEETKDAEVAEELSASRADIERILRVNKQRMKDTRTVRVFVSSTFRDFALERDYLMRHALPQLRKFGESRGVTVVFVDLRWGVTSEESSSGAVVKLCLQEIDACRPFFVGMLGERYGWHLDPCREDSLLETTMDIGEKIYPWVKGFRRRSVTELEMLHGSLLHPNLAGYSTFYFRQHEAFKNEMAGQIPDADLPAYEAETEYAKKGQDNLKKQIRETFPQHVFEYSNVEMLSDKLVEDISAAIEAEFPVDPDQFTIWEATDLQHEAFAASKRMGYVPGPSGFEELDKLIAQSNHVAVIGHSGLGKSAMVANWIPHYSRKHSEACIFSHFIGCTTESTSHFHILRRMVYFFSKAFSIDVSNFFETQSRLRRSETKRRLDVADEALVGTDELVLLLGEEKLVEMVPDFLVSVVDHAKLANRNVFIVLDGLDQLEDHGNSHTLFWLPQVAGVQYVCSIRTVQEGGEFAAAALLQKQPSERGIDDLETGFSSAEVGNAARNKQNLKKLTRSTKYTIAARQKKRADKAATTALRCWENRGWTTWAVAELNPDTQRKVIVNYLAEHAKKLDDKQISMVLGAKPAHNPLFLRTLLDEARLFGNFFQLTNHLAMLLEADSNPELYVRVLERMSSECGHDTTLWSAGLIWCARDGVTDQELREILAQPVTETCKKNCSFEKLNTKPFHLENDTQVLKLTQLLFGLREQLCSTSGLLRLFHDAAKEAVSTALGEEEDARLVFHHRLADYFGSLSENVNTLSEDDLEIRLARQLREYPHHLSLSEQYELLAEYLSRPAVLDSMLKDESKKYELVNYWRIIEDAWSEKSSRLSEKEIEKEVEPGTGRPTHTVEGYLAAVANEAKTGIDIKALQTLPQHEAEELKGKIEDAARVMDNVSTLLVLLSMYDSAVDIRQTEISFNTVLYGSIHDKISVSCSELADVYERVFCKYDVSMELKARAVEIDKKLYGEENRQIAVGYDNLAMLHLKLGNYKAAEEMYTKSLAIKEKVCGEAHRDVAQTACSLGLLHEELGDLDKARKWYERSLAIRTKSYGSVHPSVARSQIDLGMLLMKEKDSDLRATVLPLVLQGFENLVASLGLTHTDVAAAANNLGLVYAQLGEYPIALKYHLQAQTIQVARLGNDHPAYAATCSNIGSVCQELALEAARKGGRDKEETGYLEKAEEHYSRAVLIYRVKIGEQHPELATALHNLGTLHYDAVTREVDAATDIRQSLAELCQEDDAERESLEQELNQALDRVSESLQAASAAFEEAYSIRSKVFGEEHTSTIGTKESLDVCRDRLKRFEESNGEDLGNSGEGDEEGDLVVACANNLSQLESIVGEAFVSKAGSKDAKVAWSSEAFSKVLDKVSLELAIQMPTEEDIEEAKESLDLTKTDTLDAATYARLVQSILKAVYL